MKAKSQVNVIRYRAVIFLFFSFFLAVQLAHISPWTWSVRCTDSRSSSAPSCAANPHAPSHNQFCAVTLIQKSHLATENKEEQRWWNILLSVSANSYRLSFAKAPKFCKHKWGRKVVKRPSCQHNGNKAQQHLGLCHCLKNCTVRGRVYQLLGWQETRQSCSRHGNQANKANKTNKSRPRNQVLLMDKGKKVWDISCACVQCCRWF